MNHPTIRDFPFDLARSICVVWIVGFWHMQNYFSPDNKLSGDSLTVCFDITTSVLACFTFLSGFFLKKYEYTNIEDVLYFYKKRLIRFYPLFVIAVVGLVICGSTIQQGLLAILGLSMFFPSPIHTLWYFSMLLFFYMLTPLLKIRRDEWRKNVVPIVLMLSVLVLGYFFFDKRLVIYFPFYVLGLNNSNHTVVKLLNP